MENGSLAGQIKKRIAEFDEKEIFSKNNFSDLGRDDIVIKTLYRMEKTDEIVRVANGLYMKPVHTQFGVLKSTLNEIAYAIAKKNHEDIIPTGSTALNTLGLSTQVPMKAVYITNGSRRTINIDKRKIVFKGGSHKYFLYKSDLIPLVVLALKELGQNGVTEDIKEKINKLILDSTEDTATLIKDVNLSPVWIKNILLPILNTKKNLSYDLGKIHKR